MIASLRGLAIAGALALALVVAVIVDVARTPAPSDRALVPGLDPAAVTELAWSRGGRSLRVTRAGASWLLARDRAPAVLADPSAVAEVLAALRGARWHRRGPAPAPHATLTITAGATRTIGLGGPLAGAEQDWLAVDGRGALVDRWVARALDRDELALRVRRPFAAVERAAVIAVAGERDGAAIAVSLVGQPRRQPEPPLLVAAPLAADLTRALREVEIVRLPDGELGTASLVIMVDAIQLGLVGACPGAPDLVAAIGSLGDGCITAANATAIVAAASALTGPPGALIERRLVPFEPTRIVLPDGALDVTRLRIAEQPADPARVAELVAALAAPAELATRPARVAQTLEVTGAAGAITLELFAERVVARRGEPIALRPAPGAWALLTRPARALRDPVPWLEEPTTITELRVDAVTYRRGATIGAWTRAAGTADAAALEALTAALAAPRVLAVLDQIGAITHTVTLTVTPPVGAPVTHVVELAAPRPDGCPARIAGAALRLPVEVCSRAAQLAR